MLGYRLRHVLRLVLQVSLPMVLPEPQLEAPDLQASRPTVQLAGLLAPEARLLQKPVLLGHLQLLEACHWACRCQWGCS